MRIGLVLSPMSETNLKLAAQIGASDVVYYDMDGMPDTYEELARHKSRVADFGLQMSVVEGGPPVTDIVLATGRRDAAIEHFKRCLDAMGRAGVRTLCYNFMPRPVRVFRTSYATPGRGGALTSSFRLADFDAAARTDAGEASDEQLWDRLEYFLKRIVPAAEAAEVRLAVHPDDPPISPLCGVARILRSPDHFQRLIDLVPSACNGLTFCQGCFTEMGADIPATIRRFARHIHFAHFRDVAGTATDFTETFHDNGPTDMAAAMRAYFQINYRGVIRPDHVPLLAGEPGPANGYTMLGRLFAVGYMRGLMHAIERDPRGPA